MSYKLIEKIKRIMLMFLIALMATLVYALYTNIYAFADINSTNSEECAVKIYKIDNINKLPHNFAELKTLIPSFNTPYEENWRICCPITSINENDFIAYGFIDKCDIDIYLEHFINKTDFYAPQILKYEHYWDKVGWDEIEIINEKNRILKRGLVFDFAFWKSMIGGDCLYIGDFDNKDDFCFNLFFKHNPHLDSKADIRNNFTARNIPYKIDYFELIDNEHLIIDDESTFSLSPGTNTEEADYTNNVAEHGTCYYVEAYNKNKSVGKKEILREPESLGMIDDKFKMNLSDNSVDKIVIRPYDDFHSEINKAIQTLGEPKDGYYQKKLCDLKNGFGLYGLIEQLPDSDTNEIFLKDHYNACSKVIAYDKVIIKHDSGEIPNSNDSNWNWKVDFNFDFYLYNPNAESTIYQIDEQIKYHRYEFCEIDLSSTNVSLYRKDVCRESIDLLRVRVYNSDTNTSTLFSSTFNNYSGYFSALVFDSNNPQLHFDFEDSKLDKESMYVEFSLFPETEHQIKQIPSSTEKFETTPKIDYPNTWPYKHEIAEFCGGIKLFGIINFCYEESWNQHFDSDGLIYYDETCLELNDNVDMQKYIKNSCQEIFGYPDDQDEYRESGEISIFDVSTNSKETEYTRVANYCNDDINSKEKVESRGSFFLGLMEKQFLTIDNNIVTHFSDKKVLNLSKVNLSFDNFKSKNDYTASQKLQFKCKFEDFIIAKYDFNDRQKYSFITDNDDIWCDVYSNNLATSNGLYDDVHLSFGSSKITFSNVLHTIRQKSLKDLNCSFYSTVELKVINPLSIEVAPLCSVRKKIISGIEYYEYNLNFNNIHSIFNSYMPLCSNNTGLKRDNFSIKTYFQDRNVVTLMFEYWEYIYFDLDIDDYPNPGPVSVTPYSLPYISFIPANDNYEFDTFNNIEYISANNAKNYEFIMPLVHTKPSYSVELLDMENENINYGTITVTEGQKYDFSNINNDSITGWYADVDSNECYSSESVVKRNGPEKLYARHKHIIHYLIPNINSDNNEDWIEWAQCEQFYKRVYIVPAQCPNIGDKYFFKRWYLDTKFIIKFDTNGIFNSNDENLYVYALFYLKNKVDTETISDTINVKFLVNDGCFVDEQNSNSVTIEQKFDSELIIPSDVPVSKDETKMFCCWYCRYNKKNIYITPNCQINDLCDRSSTKDIVCYALFIDRSSIFLYGNGQKFLIDNNACLQKSVNIDQFFTLNYISFDDPSMNALGLYDLNDNRYEINSELSTIDIYDSNNVKIRTLNKNEVLGNMPNFLYIKWDK